MRQRSIVAPMIAVTILAAAARLAVLPFATSDGGDSVSRVWIAWRWLSDPSFIPNDVWGPLHFYLIGGVLALFPDPVLPPVLFHVILGVGVSLLLYVFTREEFGSERAALLVALTFAVYPIAVRNSVSVRSETPFVLALLAAMIFISRATRREDGRVQAIAAGVFVGLAGMLRYEAWMLTPFLAALFWRKRFCGLLFLSVSVVLPVIWCVASWINTGDPLYGVNWASTWTLDLMGRRDVPFYGRLRTGLLYPLKLYQGLTPIAAVAAIAGAALSLWKRERSAVWLFPLGMLTALQISAMFRGSLASKLNYTETLGLMLLPFSAVIYKQFGIDANFRRSAIVGVLMVTSVLAFSSDYWLRTNPPAYLKGVSSIPRIQNQETVFRISEAVASNLRSGRSGFISDFYDWGPTYYAALLTRVHPDRIYLAPPALAAPGEFNQEVDFDQLAKFLENHADGVLLLKAGSRFSADIGLERDEIARIGAIALRLEPVGSFPSPEAESGSANSRLDVYRYYRAQN